MMSLVGMVDSTHVFKALWKVLGNSEYPKDIIQVCSHCWSTDLLHMENALSEMAYVVNKLSTKAY